MSTPPQSWSAPGLENAEPQHEPILLPVQGQIPSWLAGSLYRTGPGTFRVQPTSSDKSQPKPEVNFSHWFDGLGMNHHFQITPKGEVYYSNRSSSDGRIAQVEQFGRVPGVTFGKQQDPCENLFKKFFTTYVPQSKAGTTNADSSANRPDNENISVTLSANIPGISSHNATKSSATGLRYLVAKTDLNRLQVLDPDSLKPLELVTYARIDPRLKGQFSAAHSCEDPFTGEYFNYVQKFNPSKVYNVFRVTPSPTPEGKAKVDILAEITDAPMAYIHSFSITKKYVVLCIWQSDYNISSTSPPTHKDILSCLKPWDPRRDTLFYVISREHGGVVAKYQAPTFFTFHTINAYDTPSKSDPTLDDITIDLTWYETNAVLDSLYLDHMRIVKPGQNIEIPAARRYTLSGISSPNPSSPPLGSKQLPIRDAKVEFSLSNIELPTIHPQAYSAPYRYAYGTHRAESNAPGVFVDSIVKIDVKTRSWKTWGAEGYTTGEPIFVPRPYNRGVNKPVMESEEDDGVVLSVVLDGVKQRSMLVVLDAKNLTEIARAEMDRCVPLGFHGLFKGKTVSEEKERARL
ncbi:Beta,beta-carotene 9',10'-oxygenase [Leucoagaricus sp. SymC.cos]|nr:Beta,beta-carotene 9',10'-oxygenase [Leucoagaricus sp. SymC.cos]